VERGDGIQLRLHFSEATAASPLEIPWAPAVLDLFRAVCHIAAVALASGRVELHTCLNLNEASKRLLGSGAVWIKARSRVESARNAFDRACVLRVGTGYGTAMKLTSSTTLTMQSAPGGTHVSPTTRPIAELRELVIPLEVA